MTAGTERGVIERLSLKKGAFIGACVYLVGYLVTYAVTVERVNTKLAKMDLNAKLSFFGIGVAPWKVTGWFYYDAHFVGVATRGMINVPVNLITLSINDPYVLLFALPPFLLFVAGIIPAYLAGAERRTVAAAAGLTVVPGYLVLAFIGAFLTQVNFILAVAGPKIPVALAAGFFYPLVFGSLGGVLAATIQQSRASSSPHGSNP